MKKISFFTLLTLATLAFGFLAFTPAKKGNTPIDQENTPTTEKKGVHWYSWEEAMKLQEKEPRDIIIDVYTDWCGWCKRMDAATFKDPAVGDFVNENFYAIKFDAEQKETIVFSGHEFKFLNAGRRGIHELAYSIMDGRASYPTVVYFNSKMQRVMISPGYKDSDAIMKELKFVADKEYAKTTWQDYKKEN